MNDIEILLDVCWICRHRRSRSSSRNTTCRLRGPFSNEILKAVAARVKPDDKSDHLLLSPETEDVGPYQLHHPEISALSRPVSCTWKCEGPLLMRA